MASSKQKSSGKRSAKSRTSQTSSRSIKKRVARGGGNGHEGRLEQPKSPMPAQHQRKPGQEHKLNPKP
ncbi:MAG TPA: hypothetical protein VFZ71_09970, partial [Pyrinomonadaceae bacterium]